MKKNKLFIILVMLFLSEMKILSAQSNSELANQYDYNHDFANETVEKNVAKNQKSTSSNVTYTETDEADKIIHIFIFLFIILVVFYIIGRFFSDKTECVILSSYKEIFLLFTPCLLIIFLFFIAAAAIEINEKLISFLFIISFIISITSAIAFSIYENLGTKRVVLYIIVSLITKLALFIISPIILLLCAEGMKETKKDKRFKDGTKNNQKTKNIAFLLTILAGLIFSLIKTPKKLNISEINKNPRTL